MIKCLLISPLDPVVPAKLENLVGGENTYTRTLLEYPPAGVVYTHYTQALREGRIQFSLWQKPLDSLIKLRLVPPGAGIVCVTLKDDFDLVHAHVYSVKISNQHLPVILSDSSSNTLFLKDYLGWSERRIKTQLAFKKALYKKTNVIDPDVTPESAANLIVWSQFAKKLHTDFGADEDTITVIPPGLPSQTGFPSQTGLPSQKLHRKKNEVVNILFIGTWFERKGGEILLKAYRKLKEKELKVKLTLVGKINNDLENEKDIECFAYISRQQLLAEFFTAADILVLVPPKVEGYGLVVAEAMSFGIPSVVSRVCALPELVKDGETGLVVSPNSSEELFTALEKLVTQNKLRERLGQQARSRFEKKYLVDVTNQQLKDLYETATI